MTDKVKEILLKETPKTTVKSNSISPIINLTEPMEVKKISDVEKIQSLESIISSLKTSIDNLERLIDG